MPNIQIRQTKNPKRPLALLLCYFKRRYTLWLDWSYVTCSLINVVSTIYLRSLLPKLSLYCRSFLPSFFLSFFFFMYSFSSLEITTLTLSASAIQLMQDHSLLDSDIATLGTSIILFIPTFNSNLLIFIVNKQSLYWEAIFCPFFLFFFHQAYTLQLRNQRQALLGFVKFLLFRLTHKQDNSARRYVGGIFSKKS